ncbi:SNF2-related protein [Clostridium sp. LP20]|uniref:SNF2-related protein n=1 Tax=Clostridium sp. LP20 TaxID=3418665 RepID=UPI003EE43FF1
MNLKVIKENILKISSSFTREQGKELIRKALVKDLKSKNIEDIHHIYGRVLSNNKSKTYNTHIKIERKSSNVVDTRCTCATFEENRRHIRNYVCKHIVATSYAFYNIAKNKIENKKATPKEEKPKSEVKSKRYLALDLIIKSRKNSGILSYQCEFKIGSGVTNLIINLMDFIDKITQNKEVVFNSLFSYNPINDEFMEWDKKVIDYIILNKSKVRGKYLNLNQNELREFLKVVDENKKVIFNHEGINYQLNIKKSNIPVAFTVKADKEEFILKSHKKFPVLLNNMGDVLFYDRNIYIPRKKQLISYLPLYKKLLKNNEIRYSKSEDTLNDLLTSLKAITNNITLDEGTKKFASKLMRPNFYFYKDNGVICCKVRLNYCGYIIDLIKNRGDKSFLRDYKKEELIDMELERFKFIKKENEFIFIGDDEGLYKLLNYGLAALNKMGEVELSIDFKGIKLVNSTAITSNVEELQHYYKLKYAISDFSIAEINSAINAMRNGERFYKNKNTYLDLEDPGMVQFLGLIDDLSQEGGLGYEIDIDKNKSLYLEAKLRGGNLSFIRGGEGLQGIVEKLLNREFNKRRIPKTLNATLRNYQVTGFNWLNEITELGFGGILADDMGLGKTIQIISFILSKRKSKILIVTPTAVIYNWKDEFSKFSDSLKVGLIHGSKRDREKVINSYKDYDVLLTTYGTLKNDEEKYKDITFDYCIIDEAQNIKNPKAQSTLSVKKIKSGCNIALTGTPLENNLMELWSIFDFVMPGFLFTKEKFRAKFVLRDNVDELKSMVSPFILRRLKTEVLEKLPSKIEKKYLVEMPAKQKQIYKSYVKELKFKIENSKDRVTIFPYLTKLRELCLDPSLLIPEYTGGSGKLKVVNELVLDAIESGKKILLFSQFTSVLKKIGKDFDKEKINYLYLDGSVSAKERINLVNKFNNSDDIKVFLISLKAGGVGLNLTSASIVIHFDPWWNPAIEDQATDRAHRFGQKNMVEVIKLLAKDTIEEKIVLLQEEKKELISSLMDGKDMDGNGLKRLTDEDILKLFE